MYAILKKEDLKIDVNNFGDGVYLANLNSDRQVVICGFKDKVNEFKIQNPIGKFIQLNVSAPFHSDLMKDSSEIFMDKIKNQIFNKINLDLISNHQLVNYKNISANDYSKQLKLQIHSPVMWSDTIKTILKKETHKFIEIGPKTLLNFLPRDYKEKNTLSIEDLKMFKDRKLLVTGGAGSIGSSICNYFKNNGCEEIFSTTTNLNKVKPDQNYINFKELNLDNIENSNLENLFDFDIDFLILNAGLNKDNIFLRMSSDDWNNVLNVNLILLSTKTFYKKNGKKGLTSGIYFICSGTYW